MRLPNISGYIFKVPTPQTPIFGGESLLKLNEITRNNNLETNSFVVKASTPKGKQVSGTLNFKELMKLLKSIRANDQNNAKQLKMVQKFDDDAFFITNENIEAKNNLKMTDEIQKRKKREKPKKRKQTQQTEVVEKQAIARLPSKKLNMSIIISQLKTRALATLRDKLSQKIYPEEYVLNLASLKEEFPDNILKYFPQFKNLVEYKHKFQHRGMGIVDSEIVQHMKFEMEDFKKIISSNGKSNEKKDTRFSFTETKEVEIIDAMKLKRLAKVKTELSKKLLTNEDFLQLKKSQDPFKVLLQTLNVRTKLQNLKTNELDALKKKFKIQSENTDQIKKEILALAPSRVIAALKKAPTTVTSERTQGPRKEQISGRKQKARAPRRKTNNNTSQNTNSKSLHFNSAHVSKISLMNLTNLTHTQSVPLPNVTKVASLSTSELEEIILKYSMLVAMKQRLEDKMKDTTELMEFIEPYKCVNEFIATQHTDMVPANEEENYDSTLGCLSEIYSMKHMFKEQKAIIRFASGLTKTEVFTGDKATSFLSQIKHLSGGATHTISEISKEWTGKYGIEKMDAPRDFTQEAEVGTAGEGTSEVSFNILLDILGYGEEKVKTGKGGKKAHLPPPKKIGHEDNPPGHASHMLTHAYRHGYCMESDESGCMESDDDIANMRLDKQFWRLRLQHYGVFDALQNKEMPDLNDIKQDKNCLMADCEKHCRIKSKRYCGGIDSLVKRMLNYEIPKTKHDNKGMNINFNKVILDLSSEAKRIKEHAAKRKKYIRKAKTVEDIKNTIKRLSNERDQLRITLEQKRNQQNGHAMLLGENERLKKVQRDLSEATSTLLRAQARNVITTHFSKKGMQARIRDMMENPAQAFGLLTTIEKRRVIKESDFDDILKITNGDKQKATTTTILSLIEMGAGAIVPVQHKGKLDHAVVVSMPGGRVEVISKNAVKTTIEHNPLSILSVEAGDMISGVGDMRKVKGGIKESKLEDVFNGRTKKFINDASSSFKEIVKDLNASHVVVSDRIERRKNRRSEEFTRKLKLYPLRFMNNSINKDDEVLLKYMYKELVFKMESTRQWILKQEPRRMPSEPSDYFEILYNHFIGFHVQKGSRVHKQYTSENIKKIYTIFKTSKRIQDVLQNMFTSDRKLREVYQYAADDYFNKGLLNVSSCASDFMLLGKSRHVAINPFVVDKIRQRKIEKEIKKYNPQRRKLQTEATEINIQMAKDKKDNTLNPQKIVSAQHRLSIIARLRKILDKKQSRWLKLKENASKGTVTHINNMTAKEPLSVTSMKGNTMFFKQATLLANFIGYLKAPENAPKERIGRKSKRKAGPKARPKARPAP